ncbi:hypothetical protein SDC9_131041 [bioreactor metagenome]|uniref:Uncharacterized protein n=1 Tax=bioreactor metagenome TaxID=1076179 RepID=A0A645D445_9ZZZZ
MLQGFFRQAHHAGGRSNSFQTATVAASTFEYRIISDVKMPYFSPATVMPRNQLIMANDSSPDART